MAAKWITLAPGIRAREHETRRHGPRPDRYFVLRHRADGRRAEEALGWASEGWTLQKAQEQLVRLKEAGRLGEGETSLKEKREKARLAKEADARAEAERAETDRKRAKLEKTVEELWIRYLGEVVANNKESTRQEKVRIWSNKIKPAIGAMMVKDVTPEDAAGIVRACLKLNEEGIVVGGRAEGGNVYRLLRHLFRKALLWGWRPRELGNPLEGTPEPKAPRRERLLRGAEIGALMRALERAREDRSELAVVVRVLEAAVVTGWRAGELVTLRRSFLRPEEGVVFLSDTKTGASPRPVSAAFFELIEQVEPAPGVDWVFWKPEDTEQHVTYSVVEKALRRVVEGAGLQGVTLHVIRHWFATQTANSVSNPRVGMALTGHRSYAAYVRYLHAEKEQAVNVAGDIASLAIRHRDAVAGDVVKLPTTRKKAP